MQGTVVFVAMNITKFIETNIRAILLSAGGILLVCVVAAIVIQLRAARESKAQSKLWETKRDMEKLVADKKWDEAVARLSELTSKFKGTHAAFDASLSLADIFVQQQKYQEAAQQFQVSAENAPDKFAKMLAIYNRGTAEEQSGKCDMAVKSYEEAIKIGVGDFLNPELLMAQARCWEILGDSTKALAIYKEVREKYTNKSYYSNAAAVFQQRLSEVKN
jgi:tetratricopeptide (TPR) repeat protein